MATGSQRLLRVLLTAAAAAALAPVAARAHAVIIASQPGVDAIVAGASVPIELRFNSRIDHQRSRVTLVEPDGKTATLPLGTETTPDLLTTSASGLAPGAYRLHWQVLSIDGHITRGDIPFKVSE
jgi:methionine-rich copper-binding protein CopC